MNDPSQPPRSETPSPEAPGEFGPERLARIAGHVRGMLEELGLDLDDPNLRDTDRRVARLYTEMFHGLLPGSLASRPSPLVG